jgi:hypothetical protein
LCSSAGRRGAGGIDRVAVAAGPTVMGPTARVLLRARRERYGCGPPLTGSQVIAVFLRNVSTSTGGTSAAGSGPRRVMPVPEHAIDHLHGWQVVEIYRDAGISGAKGRDQRPGLDAMLKDASRSRFDVLMAWAIDRIGRSLDPGPRSRGCRSLPRSAAP